MNDLIARFEKVFVNLPLSERANPIYMSPDHGPLSWYVVRLEAYANTKVGRQALKFMSEQQFI